MPVVVPAVRALIVSDDSCLMRLLEILRKSELIGQNLGDASAQLEFWASNGNNDACYALGAMSHFGVGGDLSEEKAKRWLQRASEGGNCYAKFLLTPLIELQKRDWILREKETSMDEHCVPFLLWGAVACDAQGNSEASLRLARDAAKYRDASAMFLLGGYLVNMNKEPFIAEGRAWIGDAADAGSLFALRWMASAYSVGSFGIEKNLERSRIMDNKAAIIEAQRFVDLGLMR